MSDSNRDFLPKRSRRESTASAPHSALAHPLPQEDEVIPIKPTPSDPDLPKLKLSGEPTDDSPTIISKKPPQTEEEDPDGLRGRNLAHFELIEKIGVGGMAAVLKARDMQLDRFVALKILPPDLAGDEDNVQRFHQEARSAAKLDHQNIARVFFCGQDQSLNFIAFEFVEGENLRVLLERDGPLEVVQALSYMIQITAGLCHAAERGVVHRDIKPSNIIITPTGRAKLVDMGLARSRESASKQDLTHSGVTLGTFDYLSPEQAINPRTADVRSDIYSLGCTFYHMLTGRPPVPEGTAAKKLHYHQHINPTDPRMLIAGLPDEVAIILDRMMAKKPSQRYQSAEELLSHLGNVAKSIQRTPDESDGLVVIETKGASSSRSRLSSVGLAIGVLAVICLVLTVHQALPESTIPKEAHTLVPTRTQTFKDKQQRPIAPTKVKADNPKDPRGPLKSATLPAQFDSETAKLPLEDWLRQNQKAQRIEVILDRDLDLPISQETPNPGLIFRASEKVTIRAKYPGTRPTLRLSYEGIPPTAKPWSAITIASPASHIEGIRILLNANEGDVSMVGLLLQGGESHRVQRCDFYQSLPKNAKLTSVLVDNATASKTVPKVQFSECSWLGFEGLESKVPPERSQSVSLEFQVGENGGRLAVRSQGSTELSFTDCMLGPHATAFLLSGAGENSFHVDHCSFLLNGPSTVFQVEDTVRTTLDVQHSLFSAPTNEPSGLLLPTNRERGPVLVHQVKETSQITYEGHDNRYHQLSSFWLVTEDLGTAEPRIQVEMTQFGQALKAQSLGKDDSLVILGHPWKSPQPMERLSSFAFDFSPSLSLATVEASAEDNEVQLVQTFQIDDRVRSLRQSDSWKDHVIGIQRRGNHSYIANLAKLPELPLGDGEKKYVDPSAPDPTNGVYASLEEAVLAARPGNTILIRHDGLLPVRPIQLEKDSLELTIRPAMGSHPILTMGETRSLNAALFTLLDGKLTLEGLQFLLQPKHNRFLTQTVVSMLGQGQCSFSSCVVTLDPAGNDVHLSVASQELAKNVMRPGSTNPNEKPARIVVQSSFVRGNGDLVRASNGESCEIDVANSIVALKGSLLLTEAVRVPPADIEDLREEEVFPTLLAEPPKVIALRLDRVTTWLGGNFLHVKGPSDFKGLPTISVRPTESLFLAAPSAGPFVHASVESPELDVLRAKIQWEAGRNAYGSWPALFDSDGMRPEMPVNVEQWKNFTNESFTADFGSKYRVKLTESPPEGAFTELLPSHFKAMDLRVGANSNHLPRPTSESE